MARDYRFSHDRYTDLGLVPGAGGGLPAFTSQASVNTGTTGGSASAGPPIVWRPSFATMMQKTLDMLNAALLYGAIQGNSIRHSEILNADVSVYGLRDAIQGLINDALNSRVSEQTIKDNFTKTVEAFKSLKDVFPDRLYRDTLERARRARQSALVPIRFRRFFELALTTPGALIRVQPTRAQFTATGGGRVTGGPSIVGRTGGSGATITGQTPEMTEAQCVDESIRALCMGPDGRAKCPPRCHSVYFPADDLTRVDCRSIPDCVTFPQGGGCPAVCQIRGDANDNPEFNCASFPGCLSQPQGADCPQPCRFSCDGIPDCLTSPQGPGCPSNCRTTIARRQQPRTGAVVGGAAIVAALFYFLR